MAKKDAAKLKLREELLRQEVALMERLAEYRRKNLIEFFDSRPNPGPNPRQAEILEAFLDWRYKTFTFTGGNRLGKTTLLTILGICVMCGKYLWTEGFLANSSLLGMFNHNKPRKIRYIGQGWHDHIETVVIPELRKWWPDVRKVKTRGNGIITDTSWRDEKSGSTLEIMSNNQDSRVMEGWSGDLILYDEPPKREVRIANARGLIDRRGREIFAATLLGEPWLHQEIIQKRLEDGRLDPTVFNVHGESFDNVGFGITKEGIEDFASKLTEEEYTARIKGVPSYLEGLVYPQFNRRVHVKDRFEIPLNWMVDVLIDVHPREKQAILFIATDEWNRKWLIDEVWDNGDGTWVGEQVARRVTRNAYRVNRVAVDPLAKGDQNNPNTVFDKIQQVLFKYGMVLETATKDKDSGILEVKKCLKGPNGEPSLFVFSDLVRTIREFEGYMWDEKTQKAIKKDDHMMENLYRGIMLNTQYMDMDEYEDNDMEMTGRSAIGGY